MEVMNLQKKFLLLQVNDSLFPIGGYSHSYGLETYIQKGLVCDEKTAKGYMENRIKYSLSYTDLLAIRLAWEAADAQSLTEIETLEEELEAARIPMEIREAARKLGNRFVKTVLQMDVVKEMELFQKYVGMRKNQTTAHQVAYGVFCRSLGVELREALVTYLYAQVSAMVTNCVKTIPLSQSVGQKMLSALSPLMEQVMEEVLGCDRAMLCVSTPGFDVRSMEHEYLYSRIYMS